jgi:xanthine dehydrogenase YagR molybdenum-binding subunit
VPWSSRHLAECYRVGAQRFGWADRPRTPRSRTDGDWLIGMGTATAVYPANRLSTAAKVRFQEDGTVAISSAGADLGTGMFTVLAILGADSLGLDLSLIKAELGDSALPSNFGAFGSASTAGVAPAVRAAAGSAVTALIKLAVGDPDSPLYGLATSAVSYRNGELVGGGRTVGFGALLKTTGTAGVEAVETSAGGDEATRYAFHSFGAHFCEVRVNRWTGEPRIARISTVVDAGTIVNPKAAHGQIVGGVIFGIGQALLEGAAFDPATGRLINANLADYLLPVNADLAPIDVTFLNYPDTQFNSVGVRGIGEIGAVGSAAAIANAVYNATGIRVRDLPIRLDALLGSEP